METHSRALWRVAEWGDSHEPRLAQILCDEHKTTIAVGLDWTTADDIVTCHNDVIPALSALDVPAHPEGVKASAEHGPETEAVLRRDGFFLTIEWWRLGTKLTARVYEPQGLPISAALADLLALALEERPKLAASALSHPEPVAQETVAWQVWDNGRWIDEDEDIIELRREQGYKIRPLYLHPSPSGGEEP